MENNAEQIKKLAKFFNTDRIVSPQDINDVLSAIVTLLSNFKKSTQSLNDETKTLLTNIVGNVQAKHDKILAEIDTKTDDTKNGVLDTFNGKVAEINTLIKEFKKIKPKDGQPGQSADVEKIIQEVLARIELPEYKETLLDDGDALVAKINELPTDDPDCQIDASHIKNLPQAPEQQPWSRGGVRQITSANGSVGISSTGAGGRGIVDLSFNGSTYAPITITGTVDGSNRVFTIPSGVIASSLQIFDGTQYQTQGALPADYKVSGTTVTFNAGHAPVVGLTAFGATTAIAATTALSNATILGWAYSQSYALLSGTRDANEALTSGTIKWPDGSTGVFTATTLSTLFPGAIDAYTVTYVSGGNTKTITQALLTRDSGGAVTAQPALTIA